jgi:hypothetical protein
MDNTELITKMMSCALIERSIKRESRATIHAPTAKKKSMSPGTINSNTNKINPIINQITAACIKMSI